MVSLEIFDLILMKNEVGGGIIRESKWEGEKSAEFINLNSICIINLNVNQWKCCNFKSISWIATI